MINKIIKYFSDPAFKFWVDFCTLQESRNIAMNQILDNINLRSYPLHICTEEPCKLQDKQIASMLENGYKSIYTPSVATEIDLPIIKKRNKETNEAINKEFKKLK